jgi:hypothetical protein
MNYDDMIIRNQVGIGINEDPYAARGNSMYDFFSQRAVASVLNRKSIPYLDKAYADKRRILREYSIKDEIRDFVSTLSDESIVYNDERDFCSPRPLPNDYSQEIQDKFVFNNFIEGTKVPHEGIVIKAVYCNRHKVAKVINPDYLIYGEKHNVGDSH